MKDSYRIGKILKRLTGLKFVKVKQSSDISQNGLEKSEDYYSSRPSIKTLHKTKEAGKGPIVGSADIYLSHRKEMEAERLMGKQPEIEPPGKILKLPTDRKELMLRTKK